MAAVLDSIVVAYTTNISPIEFPAYLSVHLPDVFQDADGPAMNRIVFKFTHEGLIIDVLDDNMDVVDSAWHEYHDLISDIVR